MHVKSNNLYVRGQLPDQNYVNSNVNSNVNVKVNVYLEHRLFSNKSFGCYLIEFQIKPKDQFRSRKTVFDNFLFLL